MPAEEFARLERGAPAQEPGGLPDSVAKVVGLTIEAGRRTRPSRSARRAPAGKPPPPPDRPADPQGRGRSLDLRA